MSETLIMIDDLARKCGHFNSETSVNNYYGYDHPNQEETDIDEETGKEQGRCHTWCCPIAYEADIEDMKRLDPKLAEEYKNDALPDGTIESDWVVWRND